MAQLTAALAFAVPALVALVIGPGPFTVVVIIAAALLLLDLGQLLTRAGTRPVLLVAALPGLGLPLWVSSGTVDGWLRIGDVMAVAFLVTFTLLLALGRRRRVTAAAGATMLLCLVVGLGATSVLLLRGLEGGFGWVLGLVAMVVAADAAGPALKAWRARARRDERDAPASEPGLAEGVVAPLVATALVAAVLARLLAPPWTVRTAALVGLVTVLATAGGRYLQQALATDAGADLRQPTLRPGEGLVLATLDGLLFAAPAAYVLARAAVL